jgi:hypothetical protein
MPDDSLAFFYAFCNWITDCEHLQDRNKKTARWQGGLQDD